MEQNSKAALQVVHRGYVMVNGEIALSGTAAQLLSDEKQADVSSVDSVEEMVGTIINERMSQKWFTFWLLRFQIMLPGRQSASTAE